ncbi:MAG: hypothetical protein K1000chlam2_01159 [Chlamydiae bacterium]|nr:hypothetical protein [Chlamydiota bacterium]
MFNAGIFVMMDPEFFSTRCKERSIALADELLDEMGNLHQVKEALSRLKKEGYILAPLSYSDSDITEHQVRVLEILIAEPALAQRLSSFGLPLCDRQIENMIAIMFDTDQLTDRHVIWAALSALLCPLRQSVGSCFGTAPAILIHEEQPLQFLEDIQMLLSRGHLTRTFAGTEFTVPISPSPGLGGSDHRVFLEEAQTRLLKEFNLKAKDLIKPPTRQSPKLEKIEQLKMALQKEKWHFVAKTDHLLLKTWEYTLASFVDVKTEFSRWNLYSSLGLHAEEKGGIGELVYVYLQQKLEETNKKLNHFQQEYEIAFDQVRTTESLMRGISSETEGRRLKAEHQARVYHLRSCEEMRDHYHTRAQNTANFFTFFLENIDEKFQEHFQEVYDAEMQEVAPTPYDDSPAGFRLLYKHGRTHVGSWTFIHNSHEYIQALRQFFISIENPLIETCTWEEGKEEISHLTTAIVHHLNTDEFLTSAFKRMAKAHRVRLQAIPLEQMEKKPWAYTSGGTLPTLLKTYFRREGSLSEEARWVESPQDLLIFFLDILKMLPPRITQAFIEDSKKRMLATSPTHVFSILPGQELFCKGWEDPGFTYTWVRDQILHPRKHFYQKIRLEAHEQLLLIQAYAEKLPLLQAHELQRQFVPSDKPLTIGAFRKKLPHTPQTDAFLYEMLPLITPSQAEALIQKLDLKILAPYRPIGRRPFHDLLISAYPSHQSTDLHTQLATLMENETLAPPRPLLFADTNWAKFYFSFLVNPATLNLELWRTDKIGLTGAPMREWEHFVNGTVKENWSVFFRPYEYQA